MIHFTLSEKIFLGAGFGILVSVPLIAFGENFEIWFFAKVLYGLGVILIWFNR